MHCDFTYRQTATTIAHYHILTQKHTYVQKNYVPLFSVPAYVRTKFNRIQTNKMHKLEKNTTDSGLLSNILTYKLYASKYS